MRPLIPLPKRKYNAKNMKTGIFYGSSTGNTGALARQIASKLGIASTDLHDVSGASAAQTSEYDLLLLGSSTWGLGELQDDWQDFITQLATTDLSGKQVALFGCGDSASYPDTFCDAMGEIHDSLKGTGCTFVGEVDASDYSTTDSRAFVGNNALGLIADDDEPGATGERLEVWIAAIKRA